MTRSGDDADEGRPGQVDLRSDQFRELGHRLVDRVADFLAALPSRPVTVGASPDDVRRGLPPGSRLRDAGTDPGPLLDEITEHLFAKSLCNGHPRFFGYITSSAAPLGILGELLAAAVNPNVGAWKLSPVATEVEAQTVRWIADLIGVPTTYGGLLVSGGNMANIICFLAARTAKASWDVRKMGVHGSGGALRVYGSTETHTWIQKAADFVWYRYRCCAMGEGRRPTPNRHHRPPRRDRTRSCERSSPVHGRRNGGDREHRSRRSAA